MTIQYSRPSPLAFFPMVISQLGSQILKRVPEPNSVSDAEEQVHHYDSVLKTPLVVVYAIAIETLFRCGIIKDDTSDKTALDLACGPGHFTLFLAKYLKFKSTQGRDLSARMLATAAKNAVVSALDTSLNFAQGDVRNLSDLPDNHVSLSTFTDAAHHMPTIEDVGLVLREMDRVTRDDGFVFVSDLVRLRTEELTETYIKTLDAGFLEKNYPFFFQDFRYSMFAAWTVKELRSAIPKDSRRIWYHIVPRFLPSTQIIIGLPVGREKLFVTNENPWKSNANPVPKGLIETWKLAKFTVRMAAVAKISSADKE